MSLTFGSSLGAVGLHGHVRIQMVERAVCLFAAIPPTFVHSFNFLISAARSLMLLCAGNRDKGVDLQLDHVSHTARF